MPQIFGNFKANDVLLSNVYCKKLGIQGNPFETININNVSYQLSYLGLLELDNINITTLTTPVDTTNMFIDYI